MGRKFPSPHSGILFLCVVHGKIKGNALVKGFRPLIRGFFFYVEMQIGYDIIPVWFPSPHSGILFLF